MRDEGIMSREVQATDMSALFRVIHRRLKLSHVRALRMMFEWTRALVILFVAASAAALAIETLADVMALVRAEHLFG
jgi:hypothetical protein